MALRDHSTDPPAADLAIVAATALLGTRAIGVDGPAVFAASTTIEITDGAITWIGPSAEIRPVARDTIDASGLIAMPGLINTHCHAAMTFLRGVAEDVSIATWFNDYIWPMEVNVGGRDVYVGTMVGPVVWLLCGGKLVEWTVRRLGGYRRCHVVGLAARAVQTGSFCWLKGEFAERGVGARAIDRCWAAVHQHGDADGFGRFLAGGAGECRCLGV